jgi:hypothetical protein
MGNMSNALNTPEVSMPKATQLNVELENKTGSLARMCRDLASNGVNLLALSAPDIKAKSGLIRLLVANPELAQKKITKLGYFYTVEEVLYIEIKNRPGSIAKAMEKLSRANINIRYCYATAYKMSRKTGAVIAVAQEDLAKAYKLLR